MNSKTLFKTIFILIALVAGVALGLYQNDRASTHTVEFKLPQGEKATIYKDTGGEGTYSYDRTSQPVAIIPVSGKITMKSGTYDWVISNTNNYTDGIQRFTIDNDTSISIAPSLTPNILASRLISEKPAIVAALASRYPGLNLYTITGEGLYKTGNWYGAYLTANIPDNDDLRIILHKNDSGTWVVATDPPHILIGIPSHPNIPTDVIKAVNSLGS